jgi:site-specific DNA-methyltransferase (adenine-specific)
MAAMEPGGFDAVVTDPPYGLEFMGQQWDAPWKYGFSESGLRDGAQRRTAPAFGSARNPMCRTCHKHKRGNKKHVACSCETPDFDETEHRLSDMEKLEEWHRAWARETLRVAKPGAHLVAFGGTRTFHRLACAIEDAGWEIRDMLCWLFGQGFPKSLDVSKALDKAEGAEREMVAAGDPVKRMIPGADQNATGSWIKDNGREFTPTVTAPATDLAKQWDGWGSALKPGWEPIILARKPLCGTIAANVAEYGCGALNIGACRIGLAQTVTRRSLSQSSPSGWRTVGFEEPTERANPAGRYPANVVLSCACADGANGHEPGCPVRMLDEQSGNCPSNNCGHGEGHAGSAMWGGIGTHRSPGFGDVGGASRFFYTGKASRSDRGSGNNHPTVKPQDLMRWLLTLVTPQGGRVLDPFAGSGSTLVAAASLRIEAVGIELEEQWCRVARKRFEHVTAPLV